ncbi:hypothetical protein N7535_007275 [Penicillium sp. DV-2018c]|nr:hypothetical protein N7461_003301 [Penicillium sp. DV-2018c]KAJ5565637.1 hypothetical protein N7535_007275 [Penicillium sp. DV-2018c]
MPSPEMSYSPAYYQGQGSLGTTHPRSSIATPPQAARRSQEQYVLGHPLGESRPASPLSNHSTRPSNSSSRANRVHHNQTAGGSSWPGSEPREVGTIPGPGSTSSGAPKEDRTRSSWADRPSLVPGENSDASIIRVRKRPIPDDGMITHEGHDALLMLVRLTIVPLYSFGAALYTIFALLFAILTSPLRLCSFSQYLRSTPFVSQLRELLSPVLHIHERLVCLVPPSVEERSSSTQWIRSEPDSDQPSVLSEPSEAYSVLSSISVLLLSPFASMVIFLFAWTAAFFWIFSMILGNPDGTERKDDGRAAVLGVCKWWRSWLCKARKS